MEPVTSGEGMKIYCKTVIVYTVYIV